MPPKGKKGADNAEDKGFRTVGTQTLSKASLDGGGISQGKTSYDAKLEISYDRPENELLSFRQWHERMQKDHDTIFGGRPGKPKFSMWNWCNCMCAPCRYIDSVDYNFKICLICCKFRTFKTWTTGFLIAGFVYSILYVFLGKDILPGGTFFLLLLMFVLAFLIGNVFINIGLPATVAQLLVGIVFANLPFECEEDKLMTVMEYSEKLSLVIILIRAALHLDFAQIHGQCRFIMEYAMVPYTVEFVLVFLCGRYVMEMPWLWSGLLGAILAPVSLATVVSILEKNKKVAFESGQIPTVLIAASSAQIIASIYIYSILIAVLFSKGIPWVSSWWALTISIILQLTGGLLIGVVFGCIAGMFPDRRSVLAPHCRIILIGCGTVALVLGFHKLGMSGVGVLSSLTMIFIASNIWEELGWHESSNPVLYFYSILYFFIQPLAVSLVGFSMKFKNIYWAECAKTLGVILTGVTGRGLSCLIVTLDRGMPTSWYQKLFICICFMPKGAVEALLGSVLSGLVRENFQYVTNPAYTLTDLLEISLKIMHATVLGILVTSPLASLLAVFLTPRLFKRPQTP